MTSLESILIALLFNGIVGAFFGSYPVRKATQHDPIEAPGYE